MLRGASAEGDDVAFDREREGPRKWLVPGACNPRLWRRNCADPGRVGLRYVAAIPSLEIYRHPLPQLVDTVRKALIRIKVRPSLRVRLPTEKVLDVFLPRQIAAEDQIINRELSRIEYSPPPASPANELDPVPKTAPERPEKPEVLE